MAHALLETWKRRDGSQLTVAAYQAAGGIRHALADTAERLYESFDDVGKQVAKRLLLHMAAPGDAEDTRRTMSRTALLAELPDADQDIAAHLLDQLEEKRLVTADEDTVQIAHEALLRHWPRLADWLQEDRDWRREEQRLAEYTREWTNNARDPDRLLRGGALAAVQEKLDKRHRAGLGEIEKAFLVASEGREARRRRARRFIMVLLIVLTVVAGGFAEVAQHDRTLASRQQALAQSRQLAAEAAALRASNPGVSLLLSLEAYRVQPSYEAVSSLLSAQLGYFTTALDDQAGPANAVAYDPAAPLLAVAGQENAVTVWDTGSHRLALRLRGQSPFYAVAFNQAGNLLAGAEQDGVTIVWNMTTRQEAGVLGASGGPSVNAVTFDPRGQIIATAGNDETITLWSTRTMREIRTLNVGAIVNGIAISRDGTRLAAACSDHDVRVWNLAPGDIPPLVLSGHTDPVLAVAFSPDSALLASSSDDGTIRLWDSRTGAPRGVLSASTSPVDALAFSPGGTLLASGGANDAVRLWDVGTLTQVDALTGPASTVTGVAFSPSGQALTSVDTSATVGIWDVTTPPQPGSKPIAVITSTPRPGGTIATADDGEKIALWKPDGEASYAALRTPPSPAVSAGASGNATTDIALSPDGSTLAAARPGNQVTLWNTRTGHKLGTLTAPGALTSVAYRPVTGPAVIAAGSPDGYIYIWGPDASQPIQLAGDLQAPVTSVAFSPDGTLLAAGSDDGTFLLARHRSSGGWIALQPTGGPLNAVETVAFSPDGEMLATGSSTGTVQLWNITNPGDPVRLTTLTVSAQSVISVTFSDSGELAASYDDGTIRLWDIRNPASAVPLATLSGLASPTSVTWQTGSRAVSGATADGTLLTWDTEPSDIADRICDSRLSGNADDLIPYLTGVSYYPICPGE